MAKDWIPINRKLIGATESQRDAWLANYITTHKGSIRVDAFGHYWYSPSGSVNRDVLGTDPECCGQCDPGRAD